jgi:VCBS repeat-containing protein
MATEISGNTKALEAIGTVQAQTHDGTIRILQPNSPIFANDRIITGKDGMISIVFEDATQLDLGRMADVQIDEDIFLGQAPPDISEAAADVEKIQQALAEGTFDPTTDLEAPAAGPAAAGVAGDGGGGTEYVKFDLTAMEVTPESGAETIGITRNFLDPDQPAVEPVEPITPTPIIPAPPAPAPPAAAAPAPTAAAPEPPVIPPPPPPPPPPPVPVADDEIRTLDEANFQEGTDPDAPPTTVLSTSGVLSDIVLDFGDGPGGLTFVNFDGTDTETIAIDGNPANFVEVTGQFGVLVVRGDGSWTYSIQNEPDIFHNIPGATGLDDIQQDIFNFTVFDSTGDIDTGTMTMNILDDGPELIGVEARVVEEEAIVQGVPVDGGAGNLYPNLSDGNPDQTDGPEDSDYYSPGQNDVAQVTGNLNNIVDIGADDPGTFGIDLTLADLPALSSKGGMVEYRMNANGTTLEAYVAGAEAAEFPTDAILQPSGERIVFTLDVQPDGSYTFTLYDQLDHITGAGENTALQLFGGGSIGSIDFSPILTATDSDFDSISGFGMNTLSFIIVDDVPVAIADPQAINAIVQEDDMALADGDLSAGNNEDGSTNADEASGSGASSIASLFAIGSDDNYGGPGIPPGSDRDGRRQRDPHRVHRCRNRKLERRSQGSVRSCR